MLRTNDVSTDERDSVSNALKLYNSIQHKIRQNKANEFEVSIFLLYSRIFWNLRFHLDAKISDITQYGINDEIDEIVKFDTCTHLIKLNEYNLLNNIDYSRRSVKLLTAIENLYNIVVGLTNDPMDQTGEVQISSAIQELNNYKNEFVDSDALKAGKYGAVGLSALVGAVYRGGEGLIAGVAIGFFLSLGGLLPVLPVVIAVGAIAMVLAAAAGAYEHGSLAHHHLFFNSNKASNIAGAAEEMISGKRMLVAS